MTQTPMGGFPFLKILPQRPLTSDGKMNQSILWLVQFEFEKVTNKNSRNIFSRLSIGGCMDSSTKELAKSPYYMYTYEIV